MSNSKTFLSRRAVAAALFGGGTIAAAIAAPNWIRRRVSDIASFQTAFRSPFMALDRAGDSVWAAQVGQVLQGPSGLLLRVTGVKVSTPYGRQKVPLSRSRAFTVSFEAVGGMTIGSEAIYTLIDSQNRTVDLFLQRSPVASHLVHATFS
jgi:hypothetical protein